MFKKFVKMLRLIKKCLLNIWMTQRGLSILMQPWKIKMTLFILKPNQPRWKVVIRKSLPPHFIKLVRILRIFRPKVFSSQMNALSFYRSQNVLCWSKFFEPAQKFIYIFCQSQSFCAIQKDDLHSVKLVFVPTQKFLKRH